MNIPSNLIISPVELASAASIKALADALAGVGDYVPSQQERDALSVREGEAITVEGDRLRVGLVSHTYDRQQGHLTKVKAFVWDGSLMGGRWVDLLLAEWSR